ncbi:MBL fold metallo-hydrolase [Lachnospiraceae bacterium NSJ-143]|nr:MBL fold metallo-hydrolase [Lachnospiraceae bacterium NSJ-143]
MTKFCPLVSGSSGNSIFIKTEGTKILIDAGVSGRKIQECLKSIGEDCSQIDAVFITHEHTDHIKAAGILSRRFDIPLYATEGTWNAMAPLIGDVSRKNRRIIYSGEKTQLNDMVLKPFGIPHDAAEPVGYSIFSDGIKMTVATDIGHVDDTIKEAVSDSDVLLLEANHDIEMLKRGPYPYNLKQRILGLYGHMANNIAGDLIKDVFSGRMRHVFLGHLSAENNTPQLAYHTVCGILSQGNISIGSDIHIELAQRHCPSHAVEF